ncbi:MAG: DUF4041 domain-containing protein [Hyphomicrobium sp.]
MAFAPEFIPLATAAAIAFIALLGLIFEWRKRKAVEARFSVVVDADAEAARVIASARTAAKQLESDAKLRVSSAAKEAMLAAERCETRAREADARSEALRKDIDALQEAYRSKKGVYDALAQEVAIFDDRIAFAEMGVYAPHFDFTDSEQFKAAIIEARDAQKTMIAASTAVVCKTDWHVDGSRSKGKTMTNRNIRLTLRAFNNECEAAVANVRWNNANAMEKRIIRAKEQIDKLNASNSTIVTGEYLALKLKELRLTHECREKLKHEREERAEAARLAREEQKLQRDMEDAERDESRYAGMLARAKAEAAKVAGTKLEAFGEQIRVLEQALTDAQARAARAQAMAEKTSSGYVYVISNVGSFGDNVIKIGMTRRLDPMDRVRELGDASVPFVFDTHAIIYSDNAPALERALHGEFEASRINTQNYRKEFFRAALRDVEDAVRRLAPAAPFFRDIEAQEYRETLAARKAALLENGESAREAFPVSI